MSDGRDGWVEVDLGAITSNAFALAARAPRAQLAPVVKANAYGHGAVAVARVLAEAGFEPLCVATLAEALELRAAGLRQRIIVLYELPPSAVRAAVAADLEVTVASPEGVRAAIGLPIEDRGRARVQLKIDTGLTRQGLRPGQFAALAAELRKLGRMTVGVWTHLADGADPDVALPQLEVFDAAVADLRALGVEAPRHASASAAILAGYGIDYELVRPGLALYGAIPSEFSARGGNRLPTLEPAMAVRARPVRIADVPAGTPVGYGGAFTTSRPSRLVTLPVGYADGLIRALGNAQTTALVQGSRAPLVGRVSMDSCVVDVTEIVGVTRDSIFTLLGRDSGDAITLEHLAVAAGTVPQEIAVGFGRRLPFILRGDQVAAVSHAPAS